MADFSKGFPFFGLGEVSMNRLDDGVGVPSLSKMSGFDGKGDPKYDPLTLMKSALIWTAMRTLNRMAPGDLDEARKRAGAMRIRKHMKRQAKAFQGAGGPATPYYPRSRSAAGYRGSSAWAA